MSLLIISLFVVLIVIYYLLSKKKEHLTNDEALQNITSLYNSANMSVTNLNVTGHGKIMNLDVSNINVTNLSVTNWKGIIVAFSGDVTNIPSGWALCDGTNGTPDLRGRFILGYNRENIKSPNSPIIERKQRLINSNSTELDYDASGYLQANIAIISKNEGWHVGLDQIPQAKTVPYVYNQIVSAENLYPADFRYKSYQRAQRVVGPMPLPPYYVLAYIMKV